MQLDRHEQWLWKGRIMDDLSPLLTQSTSNKQGKTLVECILDIIAAPELQVHWRLRRTGVREDMPGILQREPRLYFSVNSMIGESILGFSNCEAQRTQGTHREQELENFQGLFSGLFHTSQLLQRAKTHWEVGFHIKSMSLRPRPTRLHPKLGKKNNIQQHTGPLRWSTSNPNPLNLQPHSKDEEDKWWIRTDWSPNHAKYEVTLRRTRRTGRLTVMANFVSFCWPTLAVGLCWILLQVKILRRGPLLDIVTSEDIKKGASVGYCYKWRY